jgi:hypothetical protein
MLASAVCATPLTAQATPAAQGGSVDVCSLVSNEEFQTVHGVDPRIGIIPEDPVQTEMVWGPHCDYTGGAITLYNKKTPSAELDRVLGMVKATTRVPVQGLGQRAFYTVIYPGDKYREQGFLAVFLGPRIVSFNMDAHHGETVDATRPKLEKLAKLVLPRLK